VETQKVAADFQNELLVADIVVGERHRRDMGDIAAQAANMDELGLWQPIGIRPDSMLIASERRLPAELLGWTPVGGWPLSSGKTADSGIVAAVTADPAQAEDTKREIQPTAQPGPNAGHAEQSDTSPALDFLEQQLLQQHARRDTHAERD
jgi:hypothetical protein